MNTDLQFQSPVYGWQKNEKKKNTGSCKAFCVSHKRKKANIKRYDFQANAKKHLKKAKAVFNIFVRSLLIITKKSGNFTIVSIICCNITVLTCFFKESYYHSVDQLNIFLHFIFSHFIFWSWHFDFLVLSVWYFL